MQYRNDSTVQEHVKNMVARHPYCPVFFCARKKRLGDTDVEQQRLLTVSC